MVRALFSTKSFTPGHVLGTVLLVFGTIGLAKFAIGTHEDELRAQGPYERGSRRG